jgi:hypothetical protein
LLFRLDGALLVFSCTPVPRDRGTLRWTQDMLLWRHRVENKCSTEANYGRFFPGWSRPTHRWVKRGGNRTERRRAARLPKGQLPLSFDMTEPALQGDGPVLPAPWWERAELSGAGKPPNDPAVYCIFDGAQSEPEPVYVGETSRLSARAASHLAARWPTRDPWIAYRAFPDAPKHVLHELESDLLGVRVIVQPSAFGG